jgi:hypothetical protein
MKKLFLAALILASTAGVKAQNTYTVLGGSAEPAYNTPYIDIVAIPIQQNSETVGWINIYINQNQNTHQLYGDVVVNIGTYSNYTYTVYNLNSASINPLAGAVDWALIRWPTPAACYSAANNCGTIQFSGTSGDGHTLTLELGSLYYQGYSSGRGGGYKDVMRETGGTITVQ